MALTMQAQKCAVLEFRGAKSVSVSDVDGISEMFMTYFRPAGYTMVERAQIDKVISEQGFQRSSLTDYQAVKVGRILNVSKVVVGKVSRLGGQYQVDVRVVDVESGHDVALEGATFSGDYRTNVRNLSTKLAGKIAITSGGTVQASPKPTVSAPKKRTAVEVLYGYLKIFPNELGTFELEPTSVISQINRQAKHGYNNWRIPTNEELSLLKANNYLGSGEYMTRESRRGIVLLVTDGKDYATVQAEKREQERLAEQERIKAYKEREAEQARIKAEQERLNEQKRKAKQLKDQGLVDLGLPSGTLWKDKNEAGGFYTFTYAAKRFGSNIPTNEQFEELSNECKWIWTGNGYKVIGPNGNFIILPASGTRYDGKVDNVGTKGVYWSGTRASYTLGDSEPAWLYCFSSNGRYISHDKSREWHTVRLVQKP